MARHYAQDDTREGTTMYPGLSESDCQVAAFRYQQLLAEGRHQQGVTSVLPASRGMHAVSISLRQQCGALLVRAGEHLQSVGVATREGLSSTTAGGRGATA